MQANLIELILFLFLILLGIYFAMALNLGASSKEASKIRKIFFQLAHKLYANLSETTLTGKVDDFPYTCRYHHLWFEEFSSLVTSLQSASQVGFEIYQASRLDRLAKKVGFLSRFQTGDKAFDNEFHILTDNPHFADSFFKDDGNKLYLKELFSMGVSSIKNSKEILSVSFYLCPPAFIKKLEPVTIITMVRLLLALRKRFPIFMNLKSTFRLPLNKKRSAATVFFVALPTLLAGIAGMGWNFFPTLDSTLEFKRQTLLVSFALATLFMVMMLSIMRRWTKFVPLALISVFSLGLIFFKIGPVATQFVNGLADFSALKIHEVQMVDEWIEKKSSKKIRVWSWRAPHQKETIHLHKKDFGTLGPKTKSLVVFTKQGALGFEWVADYVIVSNKDAGGVP